MKKTIFSCHIALFFVLIFAPKIFSGELVWPINCKPDDGTCHENIGYPDTDGDSVAFNCASPGYTGHQGTDISLTSWEKMDGMVSVFAAADGEVLWVFDGKYDRCPDPSEPDCQAPPEGWFQPGQSNGYRVCTETGSYCGTGDCCCFWCFDGGNVIVIKHSGVEGVFATRYDHLRKNSIIVTPGDNVTKGQKIAEVGSSGHSTGPHLHFEVWGTGFYDLVDPWAGSCGPNFDNPLWQYDPPWKTIYYGDINRDGDVDLTDAIIGLQVISGNIPAGTVTVEADINEDSKIGIEEVIYILQKSLTSQ